MREGGTLEQKQKLVEETARVSVQVRIDEVRRENWAVGEKLWSEPRS